MRPRERGDDEDDDSSPPPPPQHEPQPDSQLELDQAAATQVLEPATAPAPEPSPPRKPTTPTTPPPARAALSSLVVKPPTATDNGGDNGELPPRAVRDNGGSPPRRRREISPGERRRGSPGDLRRRERRRSPPPPRRRTPPDFRRRGSPPRYSNSRFHDEQGYGMPAGSISPPRRPRQLGGTDFVDAGGPRYAQGYQGGRGVGRFRDVSPEYERGDRTYGRGYDANGKELASFDADYVHRNDPNLSPREGDWICQNPNCGNLNFARRTHCNNCNKYRFAPDIYRSSRSPRKGYYSPPRGPAGRILGPPPTNRVVQREVTRYRSPPRGWGVADLRDYAARSPPGRLGRFADPVRRDRMDYRGELEYRGRGKFEWSPPEDYNHRERPSDGFYLGRRGQRSLSPQDPWVHDARDRSRSPIVRQLKGSFVGRGRDDRDYVEPYPARGRPRNLDAGRGRGYRQGDGPFPGKSRGDRHVISRGRNSDIY